MASGFGAVLGRVLRTALQAGASAAARQSQSRPKRAPTTRSSSSERPRPSGGARAGGAIDGLALDYTPRADGRPDPGEIVWAWVPYEEDDGRGKDRPVLVVARAGAELIGLMLTSKDHDRDADDEARHGRHWIDIGTGDWDRQRRPSEVRVDRLLHLDPASVRREGGVLDRQRYEQVAAEVRRVHGW